MDARLFGLVLFAEFLGLLNVNKNQKCTKKNTDNELNSNHSRIKPINQNWGGEEIQPQKPQLTLDKGDQEVFSTQIQSTGP